jgi:hypothetical protein
MTLATNDPDKVARFVALFPRPTEMIANLQTRVEAYHAAGRHFPLTVNDGPPTCYICCPTVAYIDYGLEETRNFAAHPALRAATSALIRAARPLLRASGMDRQVQVNNWLFSTNPVPLLTRPTVAALRDELTARFPAHALILRSLNPLADPETMAALRAEGFRLLPSRQIYILSGLTPGTRPNQDLRRDRALLRRTPHTRVGNDGFTDADYPRCAQLYADLYLRKYTPLNPDYTAAYIQGMHLSGLMKLEGLRAANGELVAVTGLFENGRTLTQPIVGYDTSRPQAEGLYRLVMQIARDHAAAHGLFFNCSAGAPRFKRNRGGIPVIEYTAVYLRHLPLPRRIAARVIEGLLTRIGVPLLKRFEL